MKEYKFVSVNINIIGFGAGGVGHRAEIRKQAEQGYRYAGYIPTDVNSHGKIREIDLIFEKEKEE